MRFRFQTKLMLAVLLTVVLVTGMVISQTEKKVRETYSRLAEEQFDEQVERFLEMRRSRLDAVAASVERLAADEQVRAVFERADFSKQSLQNIDALTHLRRPPGTSGPPGSGEGPILPPEAERGRSGGGGGSGVGGGNLSDRLVLLVDSQGETHVVGAASYGVSKAARQGIRDLSAHGGISTRQVGYLAIEAEGEREGGGESGADFDSVTLDNHRSMHSAQLVEVVIAPVLSEVIEAGSGGGDWLGAVIIGQVVNSGGVERRSTPGKAGLSEINTAVDAGSEAAAVVPNILSGTRRRLHAGVFAGGILFEGSLPTSAVEEVRLVLNEHLLGTASNASSSSAADQEVTADFDYDLTIEAPSLDTGADRDVESPPGRAHYRLFCDQLNPGGTLPPAWQVVLIPMSQLHADLRDLRLRGSGIGVGAASFGLLLAWFFSQRLARPIRDLVRATEQLRKGNFQTRVPVRAQDEFGQLAESFNQMAGDLETKEQIRELLGKVSDEAVAQALIDGNLELGGEMREVSILFCDIRGFTGLTEQKSPADVIALLNEHMTAMTEVVYANGGVIDKFVGDEIMVIFGAPKSYGDDTGNAARCALAMVERRRKLNRETSREIEVGIGVATGEVIVGCMGSTDRLNYTVIGERVNRAARLCGCADAGEVVVDEATWQKISAQAEGAERLRFKPKGYSQSVRAFRLDSMRARENSTATSPTEAKESVEFAE